MAKQKVRHGDILEIPLPKSLGFSYAKYIDLIKLDKSNRYPCLIQVYNFRTSIALESISEKETSELLFSPLLVGGVPPIVLKGGWKIIGNQAVTENEANIPLFKLHEPPVITDDNEAREWYYVIDADISKKIRSEYNEVRHLEVMGAIGSELLPIKIAMGFLKSEGKAIKDYFELQDFPERVFHNQVINTPLFYKLPESQRGRIR